MKNIFDENKLREHLEDYISISRLYFQEEKGLKFLRNIILYLFNAGDLEVNDIVKKISDISIDGGGVAMSTATKLMEIGEQKGIEKGKTIDSQEILIKFLKLKFGDDVTDDDISLINRVDNINKLQDALELLLSAERKDIVLEKIK